MDFPDSIDPMGIRNPDSDEKQQDSMGSDKIPIVSYRILCDSDGIRSDPIRSESRIGRPGSSFFLIRSLMHHTKER